MVQALIFIFHAGSECRLLHCAKSKAVATVKLNDIDDIKESQPATQG